MQPSQVFSLHPRSEKGNDPVKTLAPKQQRKGAGQSLFGRSIMNRAKQTYERLKGPVATIDVAFFEDGSVDYEGSRRYAQWVGEQGIPILLLTYGSSEFADLTEDEIFQLTAEVGEANAGRSLFIASTGWWKPAKCREFLRHADQVGADAVKVQIMPWHPKTRDVLVGFFDQLESAADIPLLLWGYAPPQFPVEVAAELAKRPHIIGMKNDGDPFYDYYDLVRATRDQDFAVISAGQMRNFAFGYQIGSPAYLCTIADTRPDLSLEFYAHLVAGRYDEAWQMVFRYEEALFHLVTGPVLQSQWLSYRKYVHELHGLFTNNAAMPTSPSLTAEQKQVAREGLEKIFGPITKVV